MEAVAAPGRPWFVYLIECVDGSIYTGIAVDVAARYAKHASGKGARYTRSRPPTRLLGTFEYADRSAASKAEYVIRRLDPRAKRALVAQGAAVPIRHVACFPFDGPNGGVMKKTSKGITSAGAKRNAARSEREAMGSTGSVKPQDKRGGAIPKQSGRKPATTGRH